MTAPARRAIRLIQECIEQGKFILTTHFSRRMDERAFFWPDVLATIEDPRGVRSGGLDELGRPIWLVTGRVGGRLFVEIVCVLDKYEHGDQAVFVTLYWK